MRSNPGRAAGLLYLLMIVLGAFSIYGPGNLIVPGNAGATAGRILASETIYRLTVVTGLSSAVVFLFLARALYRLLAGVNRNYASIMVTLVAISVAIGFAVTVNDAAAIEVLRGRNHFAAFSESQRQELAMLLLGLSAQGGVVGKIFWGLWLFPFGILVIKSGFLPRVLGALLIVNGLALIVASLTGLLIPMYSEVVNRVVFIPELGELWIMLWLLVRGAKVQAAPASMEAATT